VSHQPPRPASLLVFYAPLPCPIELQFHWGTDLIFFLNQCVLSA
jgi:hypothetical protein